MAASLAYTCCPFISPNGTLVRPIGGVVNRCGESLGFCLLVGDFWLIKQGGSVEGLPIFLSGQCKDMTSSEMPVMASPLFRRTAGHSYAIG